MTAYLAIFIALQVCINIFFLYVWRYHRKRIYELQVVVADRFNLTGEAEHDTG